MPAGVQVGFHLCYGDYEHAHFVEPTDTSWIVRSANALCAALDRNVSWFHLPVPRGRDDDAYFAPLGGLDLDPATVVYLGLVHATDGVEGATRRAAAGRRHLPTFGVATECGMGRRDPTTIPDLLRLHAALC